MKAAHFDPEAWRYVFNTPLEAGLRCTILLAAGYPSRCDLQRLVQYEYLLVHSGDVSGGPESLHPAAPHRAGELMVRRSLIERGIHLMMSRSIICRELSEKGIEYYAGEWAVPFLDGLQASYSATMRDRAVWVVERFTELNDAALDSFMRDNWSHWGSEFSEQFFLKGDA